MRVHDLETRASPEKDTRWVLRGYHRVRHERTITRRSRGALPSIPRAERASLSRRKSGPIRGFLAVERALVLRSPSGPALLMGRRARFRRPVAVSDCLTARGLRAESLEPVHSPGVSQPWEAGRPAGWVARRAEPIPAPGTVLCVPLRSCPTPCGSSGLCAVGVSGERAVSLGPMLEPCSAGHLPEAPGLLPPRRLGRGVALQHLSIPRSSVETLAHDGLVVTSPGISPPGDTLPISPHRWLEQVTRQRQIDKDIKQTAAEIKAAQADKQVQALPRAIARAREPRSRAPGPEEGAFVRGSRNTRCPPRDGEPSLVGQGR